MMRAVVLALALLFAAANASVAEKITVDPNAGQAQKPVEGDIDARLAQKVTYEAWHRPVKTILADVSKSTGVTLNAGYNKKDWQVRDRKMNVCVKDITLTQLMSSIARVMKFKWSKDANLTPPTYRLIADRKLLAALQSQASKLEEDLKNEEVKRRTTLVDAFKTAAKASGSELEALKQENPYLGQCATTGFAKMVTQMFSEQPKLRDMFVNADRMTAMDASEFSQATQKLCADVLRFGADHWADRKSVPDNLEEDIAKHIIDFEILPKPYELDMRKRLVYFGFIIASISDGTHFIGDLRDPKAASSKASGAYRLSASEQPVNSQEPWYKFQMGENSGIAEDAKEIERYLMFDPVVEHPDEPDLHRKVVVELSKEAQKAMMEQINANGGRASRRFVYQAALKAIGEAAKTNIVSDSYSVVLAENPQQPDGELKAVLDCFTDTYRCNWEKHGSIIELRRRDWYRRRSSQIPDEWLKPWRDELLKRGVPSLDTYVHIAGLTDEQIEENINSDLLLDQVVGGPGGDSPNRLFCRFYTQLSESQCSMLFSEIGLDVRALRPAQWQYYTDMFEYGWQNNWHNEEFTSPGSATVTIRGVSDTGEDGSATCRFTASLTTEDGGAKQQKWKINLRKITLPKDKAPQPVSGK